MSQCTWKLCNSDSRYNKKRDQARLMCQLYNFLSRKQTLNVVELGLKPVAERFLLKFIMSCNLSVIIYKLAMVIRTHIITKNKIGETIQFKTRIVIILLFSTKNVETDR